jgi:hypothetical protein
MVEQYAPIVGRSIKDLGKGSYVMTFNNINTKKQKEATRLRNKIRWIMNHKETRNVKQIQQYLKEIDGLRVSISTIKRHRKDIELDEFHEIEKAKVELKLEQKKQKTEIKKAVKAEKKQEFPYYIITPCEHKQRLKITSNPIQSVGCGNCGCTWDRHKRKWVDRFNGYCNWGEKPQIKHRISSSSSKLCFDYKDQFNRTRGENYV